MRRDYQSFSGIVFRVDTRCEALWGKHSHLHASDLWVKSITPYKKQLTLLLSVLYEVESLSMEKTRWTGDGSKNFYQSNEKSWKCFLLETRCKALLKSTLIALYFKRSQTKCYKQSDTVFHNFHAPSDVVLWFCSRCCTFDNELFCVSWLAMENC